MEEPSKSKKVTLVKPKQRGEGYLSALAGGMSPISMPPIPAWMMNTSMYSKLSMIPAPKGKITLYTTGLGEKLYRTPSELDFDPNAEGLNSDYKSLHDPHLKSHYTRPTTFKGLVRKKFITPEGKVICTLKEFNEYQQYLKRIHIEKLTQERKQAAARDSEEREQQRLEWSNKGDLSGYDRRVMEARMRKRKALKEQHHRLQQRLEQENLKQLRLLEEMQTKCSIEEARSKLEREKTRNKKFRREMEEHIFGVMKRNQQVEDVSRHADILKCYKMGVKDIRQLKLEDQWNRRVMIRERQMFDEANKKMDRQARIAHNIQMREKAVTNQTTRQLSTFQQIRDARALRRQQQETKIRARLDRKLKDVRKLFEQRRSKPVAGDRRRRMHPHGRGGTHHHSSWEVEHALETIDLSPADGVWKVVDKFVPISPPAPSPEPAVVTQTSEKLPRISIGEGAILEEEEGGEGDGDFSASSLELAVLFGDHYDSFISSSKNLVGNVFQALEDVKGSHYDRPDASSSQPIPSEARQTSVLRLADNTIARFVLLNVFSRAKEQILAEGGLPACPASPTTPAGPATSETADKYSASTQTSFKDLPIPTAKSLSVSDSSVVKTETRVETPVLHTSSSLLAAAVVSDALKTVTCELHQDMSAPQRSDTSLLSEETVRDAVRNVTDQLQSELAESGTSLLAEQIVTDVIKVAARTLGEQQVRGSDTSLLAEELASVAVRNAARQLQDLLPRSSSSIVAEAAAAVAVMRQLGQEPPRTSSSILAQAVAEDALKNSTRRVEDEQIIRALYPLPHTSSSLLAQAITNDTLQKVTRQLQGEALQSHTTRSLPSQAVEQLDHDLLSPRTESSLLATSATEDALKMATVQLQVETGLSSPRTSSSRLAQIVTVDALQNAAARITTAARTRPVKTSSSRLAETITRDAPKTAKVPVFTDRASSRCRSRGSGSASPFSPDLAKSATNQTVIYPDRGGGIKARAAASDIVKSVAAETVSPSPTQIEDTSYPLPGEDVTVEPSRACHQYEETVQISNEAESLASYMVQEVPDSSTAINNTPTQDDKVETNSEEEAVLLKEVNNVFRESEVDISHHQHHRQTNEGEEDQEDSDDDDDDDDMGDENIIGVVENEIIAEEESVHSLAGCLEGSVEGLTTVVKKDHSKTIFEGAVLPHDKTHASVTEKALSIEDLHEDKSGHLVHDLSDKSLHKVAESGEYSHDVTHDPDGDQRDGSIVPVYHCHPLHLGKEIISHNLSAISMKPNLRNKVPSAFSADSRNSFRNVFRPDLTHCQGSAMYLKNTLLNEISHHAHADDEAHHAHMHNVLNQPQEDIAAHHSDEVLVQLEDTGGVCYLPKRTTYRLQEHLVLTESPNEEAESDMLELENDNEDTQTYQDSGSLPAGGDCRSPEEVAEPPSSTNVSRRASNKSTRRESRSRESQGALSPRYHVGAPAAVASDIRDQGSSKEENAPPTQAASSRSVIGAVINRISSIFTRKTSVDSSSGCKSQHSPSHRLQADAVNENKNDDTCKQKGDINRSTNKGDDETICQEPTESNLGENKANVDLDTEVQALNDVDDSHDITKLDTEDSDVHVLEEPVEMTEPAAAGTSDTKEEDHTSPDEDKKSVDEAKSVSCDQPQTVPESSNKAECERVGSVSSGLPDRAKTSAKKDNSTERKERQKTKSGSEPGLHERHSMSRHRAKKAYSSLTTRPPMSSDKTPSAGSSRSSSRQKFLKPSSSPKPKTPSTSNRPASDTQTHQVNSLPYSVYKTPSPKKASSGISSSAKKPKSPILVRSATGYSAPNVQNQRSRLLSKPTSSGSVRLIKVSPAPSRYRSDKLSLTSLGKPTSKGSVRLITVTPAASTVIGHRSCSLSRQNSLGGGRSFSETKVKMSAAGTPDINDDDRKHLHSKQSTAGAASSTQRRDAAQKQPRLGTETPSTGSFVVVHAPSNTQPADKETTLVSSQSPGCADVAPAPDVLARAQEKSVLETSTPNDTPQDNSAQVIAHGDPNDVPNPAVSSTDNERPIVASVDPNGASERQSDKSRPPESSLESKTESSDGASATYQNVAEDLLLPAAEAERRSKSAISVAIERLSKLFSGTDARPSKSGHNTGGRKQQSEDKIGTVRREDKSESTIRQQGKAFGQNQSSGAQTSDNLRIREERSTRNETLKESAPNTIGSESKTGGSEPSMQLPPNTAGLTQRPPGGVLPEVASQSVGSSAHSVLGVAKDSLSDSLPPVEAVETFGPAPTVQAENWDL